VPWWCCRQGYTPSHIAANANCIKALEALYQCQPEPLTPAIFADTSKTVGGRTAMMMMMGGRMAYDDNAMR
jgi:hypothetical protein